MESRPRKTAPTTPKQASTGKPAAKRPAKPKAKRAKTPPPPVVPLRHLAMALGAEISALCAAALVAIIAVLGRSADWFAGTGFGSSLLPFAGAVLALVLAGAMLLWAWLRLRTWLKARAPAGPAVAALCIAVAAGWFAFQDGYVRDLGNFRTLVGGTQEAERVTLSHQVYAAYRRSDLAQTQRLLERAQPYLPPLEEAARNYGVDLDVFMGVGAAESSFLPRDSKDGGRGLFQITAPPKLAVEQVKDRLNVAQLDLNDPRHNAYVAAATLRHYFAEMRGDLFLGLLAYNIGPKNGGLLSIMQQYGARDFATIQPYLQNLPRDYPIRVLTSALAYRLWRTQGMLPRYEQGDNAIRIQGVGIPGL